MTSTTGKILASLASVAVIAGVGSMGTYSAFQKTTQSAGNSFTAGTLILNNSSATMDFAASMANLKPGDAAVSKCVVISNGGTLPFGSLTMTPTVTGTGLQPFLEVAINRGTGNASDCSDFVSSGVVQASTALSALPASWTEPVTGLGSTNSKQTYRVTAQLPSSVTSSSAEGKNAALTLKWDASS